MNRHFITYKCVCTVFRQPFICILFILEQRMARCLMSWGDWFLQNVPLKTGCVDYPLCSIDVLVLWHSLNELVASSNPAKGVNQMPPNPTNHISHRLPTVGMFAVWWHSLMESVHVSMPPTPPPPCQVPSLPRHHRVLRYVQEHRPLLRVRSQGDVLWGRKKYN